ncbi:ComEA family DNA-binding protein [Paenibacillus assamensis]|uniref:ComEA family DNA-binding protein n=1 Tax=Paenibacillus assamensis TaxID=311244 RepID=UPI0003FBBC21|nr:helix-hairpin-helix domain-containing protein [Paenibacillus assamensis]
MSANRKQASLVSWMVVVIVGVIGIILFAFMWLRPQLGGATEGWKPVNDQVSQLLETESSASSNGESAQKAPKVSTNVPAKAAQANESSNPTGVSGESQHDQHGVSNSLNERSNNEETPTSRDAMNANNAPSNATGKASEQNSELISLNRADEQQLDELPGVGPSKAKAIVAYREQHGKFNSIDEVMKVKGIGPKMFKKMKDKLTVD